MRRYTTDSVFAIGASHVATGKACQDYTLSRASDTYAYAIVSDGCSSGGMTDVGARVLALATATAIRATNDTRTFNANHLDFFNFFEINCHMFIAKKIIL